MRKLLAIALVVGCTALLMDLASAAQQLHAAGALAPESQMHPQDEKAVKSDSAKNEKEAKAKEEELTLDKIFPEKSFFGPSASGMAFSIDGRWGAYLYRPHIERRHGSDLWLYDTQTGESRRLTSATVLAAFQKPTRDVVRDRIEKAKKAGKLKEKKEDAKPTDAVNGEAKAKSDSEDESQQQDQEQKQEQEKNDNDDESKKEQDAEKKSDDAEKEQTNDQVKQDERKWGDWVSEKDADDDKAPRYQGVSNFTWSPTAQEFLFVSRGDIYRYVVESGEITRLTKTNTSVRDVNYWPDGSAYTYMQGNALYKVTFGNHLLTQLDPDLPSGESMSGYRVSPDGKRLVFLTSRTHPGTGAGRTVTIVNYRDRFARATEVARNMPDDPQPTRDVSVYLFEMGELFNEKSKLARVFTYSHNRPRDVIRVPNWSPDSTRVAFSMFEQSTGHVAIFEASLSQPKTEEEAKKREPKEGEESGGALATDQDEELEIEIRDAKEVYRFLHYGGPNTPRMVEPVYLPDSRRMAFLTEQSGFRHVHRLDPVYQSLDQLTSGRFEVYPIDISKDHRWMFATATAEHPTREDVYRIHLEEGRMERLSRKDGVYSEVAVCTKGESVLANHSTYGSLRELVAFKTGDESVKTLTQSHPEEAGKWTKPVPEFFVYTNRHGQEIHGKMFKPDDWTAEDKRPLLVYVYGGPLGTRKQVVDGSYGAPNYFFAYYMAKKHGYVTVTIDPRGASGYGGLFEKANFEQVGKPQVEDLVDGVKWLIEHAAVDEKRVGIHGWSFGGFQTQMCMYTEPDVFQVGIAGAGPTEWHNYNSWYSTGTIGESRQGRTDLDKYSLIPIAKNLKGRLMLVHGVEDSNVLYQDTVKVYAALLEAGKEALVELFIDPTGGHGLGGKVKTVNRYRKYEDYLLQHLGKGAAASAKEEPPADAEKAAEEANVEEKKDDDGADGDDDGNGDSETTERPR